MAQLHLFSVSSFVITQFQEHKQVIIILAIGMVTGLIAQMLLPGKGFGIITTILIGMAGAWLGDRFIKSHLTFIDGAFMRHMAAAIIGAMALMLVVNLFRGKHDENKTYWKHG